MAPSRTRERTGFNAVPTDTFLRYLYMELSVRTPDSVPWAIADGRRRLYRYIGRAGDEVEDIIKKAVSQRPGCQTAGDRGTSWLPGIPGDAGCWLKACGLEGLTCLRVPLPQAWGQPQPTAGCLCADCRDAGCWSIHKIHPSHGCAARVWRLPWRSLGVAS